MAPQRDIRREALQWTDFALLAALLVVLYGLYRVFFQKKKKALVVNPPQQEAPVSTAPAVPFHELALQELKRLEREKPWLKGKVKSYYSDLSHILNQYIESQYKVPALESTTRELEILLRSTPFPPQRMELLLGVLRQADLVKYAQAHEQKQAHEHYLLKAEELIKKTATEAS